jgi:HK97 gp10 family phage protein
MQDGVTCEIVGLDKLEETLTTLTKKAAKKILRQAGRRAGTIWKEAIEQHIESEGLLKTDYMVDHIQINTKSKSGNDGSITVSVGPAEDAFYGRFAEFGTSKEPARPFMRPAFDETSDQVLQVFIDEVWNACEDLRDTSAGS